MNLVAAFILGLAGSLHCAAMCGPLLLALAAARRKAVPAWAWLHHGGRIAMYTVLGAISGALGAAVVWGGFERWLSMAAGLVVLILAVCQFRGRAIFGARFGVNLKNRFARLLKSRSTLAAFGLGAINGLLPCGLVYVACAAAAASGSVSGGVAVMLAFGLGTIPMLLGIHFASRPFAWANALRWRGLVFVCAMIAGGLLILRGLALGVPYLSPSSNNGRAAPCCHNQFW